MQCSEGRFSHPVGSGLMAWLVAGLTPIARAGTRSGDGLESEAVYANSTLGARCFRIWISDDLDGWASERLSRGQGVIL